MLELESVKIDNILSLLNLKFDPEELKRINSKEPLILVCNRPLGYMEEFIIYKLFNEVRKDLVFFNNTQITQITQINELSAPSFIEDNPYEIDKVFQENKVLCTFPVGTISRYKSKRKGFVDSEWNKKTIKKLNALACNILPIYIYIENNDIYKLLHLIDNELLNFNTILDLIQKSDVTFSIRIGKEIKYKSWNFKNYNQFGRFIRAKLYSLSSKLAVDIFYQNNHKVADIINEVDNHIIQQELASINDTNCIGQQGSFKIYICKAKKIPNTITEIGRLREITFRNIGEGSNNAVDLDEYDINYLHLFVYDTAVNRIVGAYRLGDGNYLMKTSGRKGFYINSLFKIKKELSFLLDDSLELGRSFIVKDYQNQRLPLYLLWKGIAYFINTHPRIKYIIGPVSISNSYSKLSKTLIVEYVIKYHWDKFLAQFVSPRNPFLTNHQELDYEILIESTNNSIKSLEEIIEDIDPNHTKIPVLLKKYFAQNARIICFNNDPKFNDSLDGFMLLDIRDMQKETLETFENIKQVDFYN